jgi:predicted permease
LVSAALAVRALRSFHPANLPRAAAIELGWPMVCAGLAVAIFSGLASSAGPSWQASRLMLASILRSGTRSSSGKGALQIRHGLVVLPVALALVLLTGAALLVRTAANLESVDLGYDPHRIVSFDVPIAMQRYPTAEKRNALYQILVRQIREIPGIESAGGVSLAPLRGGFFTSSVSYGPDAAAKWGQMSAEYRAVLPGYFETLHAHLLAGRFLTAEDSNYQVHRVVVDDGLAHAAWPGQNPIGQKLAVSGDSESKQFVFAEVVGVVKRIRQRQIRGEEPQQVFIPYGGRDDLMYGPQQMTFMVRGNRTKADLESELRRVVAASGNGRPAHTFRDLAQTVADTTSDVRFAVRVMSAFAILSLVLTAFGIYGLIAYTVEQRRFEFGIRLALGAQRGQVVNLVLGQGMRLALVGAAIGVAGSVISLRALDSLLFGISALDASTLISVAVFLCAVALAASVIPAIRTAALDPAKTMRAE